MPLKNGMFDYSTISKLSIGVVFTSSDSRSQYFAPEVDSLGLGSGSLKLDSGSFGTLYGPKADFCYTFIDARAVVSSDRLASALTHNIGHTLGLGHASRPENIMYPSLKSTPSLGLGDVNGILRLSDMMCVTWF